jgi:hypothetical protein
VSKKRKTEMQPAEGPDYKRLWEESVKTIDSLGKTMEMRRIGVRIALARLSAYHMGISMRGVTPEDQRCCILLDGILTPIFSAEAGKLRLVGDPDKTGGD